MRVQLAAALIAAAFVSGCRAPAPPLTEPRYYWKDGISAEEQERDRGQAGLEASRADTTYDPQAETWRNQEASRARRAEAVESFYLSRGYRRVTAEELRALEAGGK